MPSPDPDTPRLADLGELRLIDEIIVPLAKTYEPTAPLGDDCAIIDLNGLKLAVTADVGPRPAIMNLPGYERDFEAAGWHAVVATASDVATAGAKPLFMTNCVDAPPDLEVASLQQFMEGMFKAYRAFGFQNAGGDIRHGPTLAARITGVGLVQHNQAVGRGEVKEGDRLVLIGQPGKFMASYLIAQEDGIGVLSGEQLEWLRFPRPALSEMLELCSRGLVRAASDSSDGVLGAIDNICRRSNCSVQLELHDTYLSKAVRKASEIYRCNPWNIFFCWGDWSVVAVIPSDRYKEFKDCAERSRILFTPLGRAARSAAGKSSISIGKGVPVTIVRNENFLSRGFNAGIAGHLEYMLRTPLFNG